MGRMPDQSITCPRCGQSVTVRFYGPCDSCREELRSTMHLSVELSDESSEPTRYEPKMNVVPNQVAIKE